MVKVSFVESYNQKHLSPATLDCASLQELQDVLRFIGGFGLRDSISGIIDNQ